MRVHFMKYGNDIKKARKILGLSQIDLSNDNISRNLISDIENDKINLVPSKALIIFKLMIEAATKQGTDINLNFDELLIKNENYIKLCEVFNIYRELIRSSNTLSTSILEEYRIMIQRHDIGLMKYYVFMKLYEVIPEKEFEFRTKVLIETLSFLKWELFDKIHLYFKNVLENVTPIANRLGKHSELIHYYKYYEENMVSSGYSIDPKFYYNLALFYKKIENYIESYNYIERTLLFDKALSIEQRADLLILKGNISVENKEFEDAIVTYKEVLKILKHNNYKIQESYALSNLIYCMTLNKNEHILIKEYYIELRNLIPYIESERKNINVLYRNLAIAADYLGDAENLIIFIQFSFEECTTKSDTIDLLYKYYKYIPNAITLVPFNEHLIKIQVSTVSEKDRIKLMSIVLSIIANNYSCNNYEMAKDFNKYIINNYGGSI